MFHVPKLMHLLWIIGCLQVMNPCTEERYRNRSLLHFLVDLDKVRSSFDHPANTVVLPKCLSIDFW